jgi:demethylmenaquinone methyltransferase/2-methoxy-6-polyprenyl-1,4-benzoquinol methylase
VRPWIKRWPEDPTERARYAESIFHRVAPRYDVLTRALSFGQDGRWKSRLVAETLRAGASTSVLDLATGTAALPILLRRSGHRGPIVGLDLSRDMLSRARAKCAGLPGVTFLRGDLSRLPFASERFDAVTMGYGLRYPPDLPAFLRDVLRILRPKGRFLSLDFGLPESASYRSFGMGYLYLAGSFWGFALHGRPGTYHHIVESLRAYPGQRALAAVMNDAGFADIQIEEHLGGMAAAVTGRKP